MTRGLYFIILLSCTSVTLKAQTVEETKSWILSKLNKYQVTYVSTSECTMQVWQMRYSFSFSDDSLVVSYYASLVYPECYKGIKKHEPDAKNEIDRIPVSDITDFIYPKGKGDYILIGTKFKTVRQTVIFSNDVINAYTDGVFIGINLKTEDNLLQRLEKAFKHLVTFYPKKEKQESF